LLYLFLKEIKKLKIQNPKKEVVAMKTKKFIVYVLISLFVFSPFLNFEGWALGPRLPTLQEEPDPTDPNPERNVCTDICACDYGGYWACTRYCCVDDAGNDCMITAYSKTATIKCGFVGGWNGSILGRVAGWIQNGEIPR
jgi:hypothetical protein